MFTARDIAVGVLLFWAAGVVVWEIGAALWRLACRVVRDDLFDGRPSSKSVTE